MYVKFEITTLQQLQS